MARKIIGFELQRKIIDLKLKGNSNSQVARALGIGRTTVFREWHNRHNHSIVTKSALPENKIPQPPSDQLKANKKEGEVNWREWIPAINQIKILKHRGSWSQDEAVIELGDGTRPVVIAPFSDQHMGAWSTDYEALLDFTDELLHTSDLYIGLLGDYGQYAIKLRNVLEISDNILPPEQQTDFIESWFNDIWHKVAFATWDNHGVERQEKQAGESGLKRLLNRKVVYFNGIGHLDIKVGDQVYKGVVTHQFRGRSMLNPVHGQMRYMRFEGHDREFAMSGDSHVPGMAKYTDGSKVRVAINTGSLQTNSGYAKRYFSLTTHKVFPVLEFRHDEHTMTPYWSVADWLKARGQAQGQAREQTKGKK